MRKFTNIYLDTIDSTQAYAKAHAASFAPDAITCICAEEQTQGRGRFQRTWISPPGVNLYVTFCFTLPARDISSLAQVMAHTVATVLKQLHPQIKWPNDVLIKNKKVSGALCETVFEKDKVHCFLGLGVNVNMAAEDLARIDQPATSLLVETGRTWDRKALLKQIQEEWGKNLTLFEKAGFAPFHDAIEKILAYKGQEIRSLGGICHSLTPDGRLNVYHPETKTMETLSSGDLN